ncbi:MAG: response regulator [Nocardioidaceae bacterium]
MTGERGTRVLVVDDQELVRAGFTLILEKAGMDVVGQAGDGVEAVEAAQRTDPDVVLMDVRMPRLDGIEATRRLLAVRPATKVLALTTFDLDEYLYAAVQAGACGFLLKDVSPTDLVHAVRVVARGEAMLAPALTRRLLERFASAPPPGEPAALEGLTERELAVLRLVARGLSNQEIGAQLFLSEATVKTYVSRLLTKLDLRDRVQMAVLAYERGVVRVGESPQATP